jgi:hypothetical protein
MRVRELLAANAFCLLAVTSAACKPVEQSIGEYSFDEGVRGPELPDVLQPTPAADAGEGVSFTDGAMLPPPVLDPDPTTSTIPEPTNEPGSRPSFGLPPVSSADAGMMPVPPEGNDCTVQARPATRRRLDMYLMIDNNSTLAASRAWDDITTGLGGFVKDVRASGTGVGVRYFGDSCQSEEYEEPTIDIDVLPSNAERIIDSMRDRRWTASPMLPALQGGIAHQRDRAREHPEWKQIVVLISDGLTQDLQCLYTTQGLADAARAGLLVYPSVETHVIGVGVTTSISQPLDAFITRIGSYNAIASAGGSGEAHLTDITDDGSDFQRKLHEVRRRATPCEFEAPPGLATSEFGVARYPLAEELNYYTSERACGSRHGWYFNLRSQTPVTLCPTSCDWLTESDDNEIALLISCPPATSTTP